MRIKTLILSVFLIYIFSLCPALAAEPQLTAESAILIDAHTGRILFEKNAHEQRPMASTTKITTALIALEKGKLTDVVTASKRAADTGESSIGLKEGEKLTLEDLLYAMLLPSANDAAVAIAEHIGGSVENFAQMMNDKAKELGLADTHYVTPNGLHNKEHYTSAYDLALVAREALKNPQFRQIVSTKKRVIPGNDGQPRVLINKDKLLDDYQYAIGVKNGYTRQAGNCLVGAAEKNGLTLIAVVMKSKHMYDEVPELFDYGFENFQLMKVASRGELVHKVNVLNGTKKQVQVICSQDVFIPVKPAETGNVTKKVALVNTLQAPIKPGFKAGFLEVFLNNASFTKVDLLTSEGAEVPHSFIGTLWETFLCFLKFLT